MGSPLVCLVRRVLLVPVLLVERERRLRRRRVPYYRAERLHPHGHVHLLLRQHAHQGHLVEKVPDAHAGSFMFAFLSCVSGVFGFSKRTEGNERFHSSRRCASNLKLAKPRVAEGEWPSKKTTLASLC